MNTIQFKNIAVSFTDTGSGPAIVLLHGFLENRDMWTDITNVLSANFRVVTIDLLGHGETDCLGYVHSMEDNAAVVNAVITHLQIKKATIAGHSMGGYVALALAEMHPKTVKAIILINSTAKPDSEERKINRDRAIKAVKQNYTNFVRLSIANLFSENNRTRLENEINYVRNQALKTPLQGIVATLEGMKVRADRQSILSSGKYPVLFILGKQDPVLNYEETIDQADHKSVELITFPDGHMSPIENRDELADAILNFLKRIK